MMHVGSALLVFLLLLLLLFVDHVRRSKCGGWGIMLVLAVDAEKIHTLFN